MAEKTRSNPDNGALRLPTGLPPYNESGDPSPRSTQQVLRENFWLRELLETRLEGMDKALDLLQKFANSTPTTMDVQHKVEALREVVMSMFDGIGTQLKERDSQAERAAREVKGAVDYAFNAAKEAVTEQNKSNAMSIDKSEKALTKQLDSITEQNKTENKAINDKIGDIKEGLAISLGDIKERLTIIESKTSVQDPTTAVNIAKLNADVSRLNSTTDLSSGKSSGMVALWALLLGGVGSLLGVGTFVILLMKYVK